MLAAGLHEPGNVYSCNQCSYWGEIIGWRVAAWSQTAEAELDIKSISSLASGSRGNVGFPVTSCNFSCDPGCLQKMCRIDLVRWVKGPAVDQVSQLDLSRFPELFPYRVASFSRRLSIRLRSQLKHALQQAPHC